MTTVIDDAPAAAASGSPDPAYATTTRVGYSEATLVACALTEHVHRLFGVDIDLVGDCVRRMVHSTLVERGQAGVIDWRSRVPEGERRSRWSAACRLTARFYDGLPGSDALPDYYRLPDPAVA